MPSWPTGNSWPAATSWPSATAFPANTAWPTDNPFASGSTFAAFFPNAYVAFHADFGWNSGTNTWADQSGNGRNGTLVVASTGNPSLTTNALGGHNALTFPTNAGIIWTLTLPDPSVTPFYFWFVFRQTGWAVNGIIAAGTTTTAPGLLQVNASPQFRMQNNVAGPVSGANAAIGNFVVCEAVFTGSTSDYLKVGTGSAVNGTNCGTAHAEVTFAIGKTNGGNTGAAMDVCAFVVAPGASPPATARAQATAYWGGSLLA